MTESYIHPVRKALKSVLQTAVLGAEFDSAGAARNVTVRPPKNEHWGDLCTNVLLLLCGDDEARRQQFVPLFVEAFQTLPMIETVTVAENGYINLCYREDFWGHQVPLILVEGTAYGVSTQEKDAVIRLQKPEDAKDLLSARHTWNTNALRRIAKVWGRETVIEDEATIELKGFPTEAAISKCGEMTLRLAVLANAEDFCIHFSPLLAVDRAYSNPAFCIPYARARAASLLAKNREQTTEGEPKDLVLDQVIADLSYTLPAEQKIARFLCHWPVAMEQSLQNRDIIHLTAFLHDLSLLFFRLVEQGRLQSSDYLREAGHTAARNVLLQAVDFVICEGLKTLGIDIVEEFV